MVEGGSKTVQGDQGGVAWHSGVEVMGFSDIKPDGTWWQRPATSWTKGKFTVIMTWTKDPAEAELPPAPEKVVFLARTTGHAYGLAFTPVEAELTSLTDEVDDHPGGAWSYTHGDAVLPKGEGKIIEKDTNGATTIEWESPEMEGKVHISEGELEPFTGGNYGNIIMGIDIRHIPFSLSASPDGSAPITEPTRTGSTGARHGRVLWDGTTDSSGEPHPDGIRIVGPEEKEFYVVLQSKVTYPTFSPGANTRYNPANTITVKAERIRYSNGPNALPVPVGGPDGSADITLTRITHPNDTEGGAPVVSADGRYTTWTYRTHDLSDTEEHRISGLLDWHITDRKGRWRFSVKDGTGNTVEFKINKRGQLVAYAMEWANYYADKNSGTAEDPWNTASNPDGLFGNCFTFAGHIYKKHGLNLTPGGGATTFGPASAVDNGEGSLRFFWAERTAPSAASSPDHVGIIGPNTYWGYGTRIDNNGAPATGNSFNGPTWRGIDDGVGASPSGYFGSGATSLRPPINRTLPGEVNTAISILQELDAE